MPYFCYECNQPRSLCSPGSEPGSCAVVEQRAAELATDRAKGKSFIGGWMKGGSRQVDREMAFTHKFDRDMDRYREARRAGEHPDQISVEGIESAQKRRESIERARRKLEKVGIEVAPSGALV